MIKSFDEFLNEDLNFTTSESGDCKLSARWFYYNPDDEFRKLEDDIKDKIFDKFEISIKKMLPSNNIPSFIVNAE